MKLTTTIKVQLSQHKSNCSNDNI